jgi:2-phospho-L-lactate guanylyltransferase
MWAVIPVRGLDDAKRRLARVLDAGQRTELARAMLHDVLKVAVSVNVLEGVLLVSADREALDIAAQYGAEALVEAAPTGYSAAVAAAGRRLASRGVSGFLHLPADVPLASVAEIEQVVAEHGAAPAVTVVPDLDRRGTNCLALSPPDLLTPAFGPDSCTRHCTLAAAAGVTPKVLNLPGLGLDIDTGADLALFRASKDRQGTRTWDVLRDLPALPVGVKSDV